MNKSIFRRTAACVIALVMLACMLPVTALADGSVFNLNGGDYSGEFEDLDLFDFSYMNDDGVEYTGYRIVNFTPSDLTKSVNINYAKRDGTVFAADTADRPFQHWNASTSVLIDNEPGTVVKADDEFYVKNDELSSFRLSAVYGQADYTVDKDDPESVAESEVYFYLTLDGNGGTIRNKNDEAGTRYDTYPLGKPPKFKLWKDGSGNEYPNNTAIKVSNDITLSAVYYDETFNTKDLVIERDGWIFDGWFTEANGGTKLKTLTANCDTTVYAHWIDGNAIIIYYSAEGATNVPDRTIWSNEGYVTLSFALPIKNITVTLDPDGGTLAETTKSYEIKLKRWKDDAGNVYNPGGSNADYHFTATTTLTPESWTPVKITGLPTPTRHGYIFLGWYDGDKKVTADTESDKDMTLTAHWEIDPSALHTVTFNTNGGPAIDDQPVVDGEKASRPADPTRDGFTFDGWYSDEDCKNAYDFNTPVTGDITLYAKWKVDTGKYDFTKSKYTRTVKCGEDLVVIVKNSVYDKEGATGNKTYDNFTELQIGSKTLVENTDYKADPGSVKLTIKAAYLDKLAAGTYKMTVKFTDGSTTSDLVITSKGSGSDTAKTGDSTPVSYIIMAFALFILSFMQVAGTLCGYFANRFNSFEFVPAAASAAGNEITEAPAVKTDDTSDTEVSAEADEIACGEGSVYTEELLDTDDDLADIEDDFVDYLAEEPADEAE